MQAAYLLYVAFGNKYYRLTAMMSVRPPLSVRIKERNLRKGSPFQTNVISIFTSESLLT